MSRIDDLIAQYCPDGVGFEPLRDAGTWYGGGTPSKARPDYWQDGTIPWVSPKDMGRGVVDSTEDYITEAAVEGSSTKLVPPTSVAMVVRSSILDRIFPIALIPVPIALNQDMKAVVPRDDILPGYIAHLLRSRGEAILRAARKTGASVASIDSSNLFAFRIPVPPVEVQREIVKVLDMFSELEAALEAELEAELKTRRDQYEYYRDSLLSFHDAGSVRWVTFGEVATIVRGGSPRPIQAYLTDAEDGVNWVKIGDVAAGGKYITTTAEKIKPEGAGKSRRVAPGDFVLTNSMSFGRPYIVKIDGCIHDGWLAIKDFRETFNADFLYHLLRTSLVYKEMAQRAGGGTVQNLNAEIVKSLILPAPGLDEQERIVTILDKFDALVNDLSIGLPAELKARRQQYEYYRDKLLAFEERVT